MEGIDIKTYFNWVKPLNFMKPCNLNNLKKSIESCYSICYTIFNSTRRASDRKVKQAGFAFPGDYAGRI